MGEALSDTLRKLERAHLAQGPTPHEISTLSSAKRFRVIKGKIVKSNNGLFRLQQCLSCRFSLGPIDYKRIIWVMEYRVIDQKTEHSLLIDFVFFTFFLLHSMPWIKASSKTFLIPSPVRAEHSKYFRRWEDDQWRNRQGRW